MEDARRREIALFRYALVRPAADHDLSPRDRGRLVRDLAARDHLGPAGQRVRVARSTLDHWIRDYRQGGFDALLPAVRRGVPRTDVELLDLAVRLKREQPKRTAAQVLDIIARSRGGAGPSERTLHSEPVRGWNGVILRRWTTGWLHICRSQEAGRLYILSPGMSR
jgi:putative transposase